MPNFGHLDHAADPPPRLIQLRCQAAKRPITIVTQLEMRDSQPGGRRQRPSGLRRGLGDVGGNEEHLRTRFEDRPAAAGAAGDGRLDVAAPADRKV